MKRACLLPLLLPCLICAEARAESSVTLFGTLQAAIVHGNGGSTPIDGQGAKRWAMNDQSSTFGLAGREDLGGGHYAGFLLQAFTAVDTGAASSAQFWSTFAVAKFGGPWGELYAGRAVAPAAMMVLFVDPWYWDNSAAQAGWQIQQANYRTTSLVRTDNTLGYNSPRVAGVSVNLATSLGEGRKGRDDGVAVEYKQGA